MIDHRSLFLRSIKELAVKRPESDDGDGNRSVAPTPAGLNMFVEQLSEHPFFKQLRTDVCKGDDLVRPKPAISNLFIGDWLARMMHVPRTMQ